MTHGIIYRQNGTMADGGALNKIDFDAYTNDEGEMRDYYHLIEMTEEEFDKIYWD